MAVVCCGLMGGSQSRAELTDGSFAPVIQQWDGQARGVESASAEPAVDSPLVAERIDALFDQSQASAQTAYQTQASSNDPLMPGISQLYRSQDPWNFSITQTVDYGTNLALPLSLTPVNRLIAPITNLLDSGILNNQIVDAAGLSQYLNLPPSLNPEVPLVAVGSDDFQFQTLASLQRNMQIDNTSGYIFGYSFYQSLHPQLRNLDLDAHTINVQYYQQWSDRFTAYLDYGYSYFFLQGSSFISQNRIGPSFAYRYNDVWDLQSRFEYSYANFFTTPYLSSNNGSIQIGATRYLSSDRNTYITGGYACGYSDAELAGFSYLINSPFFVARTLVGYDQRTELRVTTSAGWYDFASTDPLQPGTQRRDRIVAITPMVTRAINDRWTAFGAYTYYNSDSNVTIQQYHQNLVSLGLTFAR